MKRDNLEERVFGKLTAKYPVSSTRSGMTRWLCICECGKDTQVASKHLKSGVTKSCGCDRPRGSTHIQWTGVGEISGDMWYTIRKHSMERTQVPITIDKEYAWQLFLDQNKQCALSSVLLHFGTDKAYRRTASLDRIDSSKGYEVGNVQWVHKDINKMKNTYTQEYFIQMCKDVARTH